MSSLPNITPSSCKQPLDVAWPTNSWPRGEVSNQDALNKVVDEMFKSENLKETNAVVVVKGGKVVAERYGGETFYFDKPAEPITASSQLISWSMAKSMLHMIIGTLNEQGLITPEQNAPVPEWSDPTDPRHNIKVKDLLEMRDGLKFVEDYDVDNPSDVIAMLYGDAKQDMAAFVASKPLAHEPGTFYNYSSGTSNVLSRIVADNVGYGEKYNDYLTKKLFRPLGMNSAVAAYDDKGVWVASSFVHATALDFAKFGLLYLRGGEWDGEQLISQDWVSTAQIPHSQDENGTYYSWQWWVTGDKYGTYWANGYEGQMISVIPSLDALVLRFGHTTDEFYPDIRAWRTRVLDVLAAS